MNRRKLYSIAILGNVSAGIFVFTVPRVFAAEEKGMLAGALTGVCMMTGYFLTAFLAGRATDRFGFRNTLTVGGCLSVIAALVAMLAPDLKTLYVAMALLGAGNGIVFPSTIAALTSTCRHDETSQVLLAYTLSWNAGLMVGVPLAGWLFGDGTGQGRTVAFSFALVASALLLLSTRLLVVHPLDESPSEPESMERGGLPPMAFAVLGWIGLFGAILSIAHLQFLFPKLALQLGMPPKLQSVMMVVHRAVGLSVYLLLFFWRSWRFRLLPMVVGNLFGIIGLGLLFLAQGVNSAFIAYVLCAPFVAIAYFCAVTYGANAFSKGRKGLAGGINESIVAAGFVLGPLLGGVIGDVWHDAQLPFAIAAGIVLVLTIGQMAVSATWRASMK